MKVNFLPSINNIYNNPTVQNKPEGIESDCEQIKSLPNYRFNSNFLIPVGGGHNLNGISFKGSEEKFPRTSREYIQAREYLSQHRKENNDEINYKALDFDKLEGIQNGIKLFDGMTIKEIFVYFKNLTNIGFIRGCKNHCLHCLCEAGTRLSNISSPLIQQKRSNEIDAMSVEDFDLMIDSLKELAERTDETFIKPVNGTIMPYYDSDAIDIVLKSKDGKREYTFVDIAEKLQGIFSTELYSTDDWDLYDKETQKKLDREIIFTTDGWDLNDKKAQKRAEEVSRFFLEKEGVGSGIMLSLNPYHPYYVGAQKLRESKDSEKIKKADKLEEKYIKQIANAIFTFLPNLPPINMLCSDDSVSTSEIYSMKALEALANKVIDEVKTMLEDDLKGRQRVVKDEKEIEEKINWLKKECTDSTGNFLASYIDPVGRAKKLFKPGTVSEEFLKAESIDELIACPITFLDANGEMHFFADMTRFGPVKKLNFENKDRTTAPLKGLYVSPDKIEGEYFEKIFNDTLDKMSVTRAF